MKATWPMQFVGLLGFCLLSIPRTVAVRIQPQEPPPLAAAPPAPRRPLRSPSQEALRAGWATVACQWFWMLAHQVAHEELEAFEGRAFEPLPAADRERCRQQLLARDRRGDWQRTPGGYRSLRLRQAAASAERAVALAQTPAETYEATVLRAAIARELGHHREELKHARTLMKRAPRNPVSLMYLRRAALRNGLEPTAAQAITRLPEGTPARSRGRPGTRGAFPSAR